MAEVEGEAETRKENKTEIDEDVSGCPSRTATEAEARSGTETQRGKGRHENVATTVTTLAERESCRGTDTWTRGDAPDTSRGSGSGVDPDRDERRPNADARARVSDSRSESKWLRLNVGGTEFLTTRHTLGREPGSVLCALGRQDATHGFCQDETGAFLVDRDPAYFSTILNFLRHGKLILNEQLTEEGVLAEAEYYNISSLVSLVKERIRQRAAAQSRHSVKHVYRVLQCREEELTQMVSTMSDGWKFEQLVAIGSAYGYSGSHQAEYLLIVSREVKTEDDGPAHVPCEVTSREVCHETESEGLLPATRGAASNGLLPEPTDKAKMLLERGSRRV
uniref:Potassium channel tetramerization domain containing 2 n=1 Tax=Eptatretus burgeri TaxID=7764 RepID=A0A8C4NH37_EPTBU